MQFTTYYKAKEKPEDISDSASDEAAQAENKNEQIVEEQNDQEDSWLDCGYDGFDTFNTIAQATNDTTHDII
ncbi:MAG: hypothetical protein PV340_04105 [Wolbachia sp.]|nr:hypothetical protein [Wolbachia sp.]MDD9335928.1 hypothetical protein [Wolbachia sp.]